MGTEKWPRKIVVGNAAVKIYRMAHATAKSGWTYVLAYHDGGARKRQKFADPDSAVAEGRIKAAQLNAGHVEGASMTKADRDELRAARVLCEGVPIRDALNEWRRINELTGKNGVIAAQAWAARNHSNFKRISVADAIKAFLKGKKAAGVDVKASYERQLPAIQEAFGSRMMDSLSARELQAWMETRYPHPVSRNTARKRMVSLWRWARRLGHLSRDILTEAEQTESAREVRTKIGTITAKTYGKLLRSIRDKHPDHLAALVLAGFAGLRRSEIHGQLWSDINLERGFLKVSQAKINTPSHRITPLSPAAIEWLLLCGNRKGRVCDNLAIDRIRDIARTAEIEIPENCFRHSFISHRVAETGNVDATALEAGNSRTIIFQHYRELFTKGEGEAWFKIGPNDAEGQIEEFG